MPKPNKNCSIGDWVRIEFDDHSEGEQHIVFEVFGRVLEKSRRSFLVGSWLYPTSKELDDNCVVWTILRAGVRSIQILKPSDESWQTPKKSAKSPRKPANSANSAQEKERPESADTIRQEPPASPASRTTTGAANTVPMKG